MSLTQLLVTFLTSTYSSLAHTLGSAPSNSSSTLGVQGTLTAEYFPNRSARDEMQAQTGRFGQRTRPHIPVELWGVAGESFPTNIYTEPVANKYLSWSGVGVTTLNTCKLWLWSIRWRSVRLAVLVRVKWRLQTIFSTSPGGALCLYLIFLALNFVSSVNVVVWPGGGVGEGDSELRRGSEKHETGWLLWKESRGFVFTFNGAYSHMVSLCHGALMMVALCCILLLFAG